MKFLKYVLPLACLLLWSGCASKSDTPEAAGNFPYHATGKARVYIYSTAAIPANIEVKLDGAHAGVAKSNGVFYVDTTPGEHSLTIGGGSPVSFHLENGGNGFVKLTETDGKLAAAPVDAAEGGKAVTALNAAK